MREINKYHVLETIRCFGRISRVEISERTLAQRHHRVRDHRRADRRRPDRGDPHRTGAGGPARTPPRAARSHPEGGLCRRHPHLGSAHHHDHRQLQGRDGRLHAIADPPGAPDRGRHRRPDRGRGSRVHRQVGHRREGTEGHRHRRARHRRSALGPEPCQLGVRRARNADRAAARKAHGDARQDRKARASGGACRELVRLCPAQPLLRRGDGRPDRRSRPVVRGRSAARRQHARAGLRPHQGRQGREAVRMRAEGLPQRLCIGRRAARGSAQRPGAGVPGNRDRRQQFHRSTFRCGQLRQRRRRWPCWSGRATCSASACRTSSTCSIRKR